MKHQSRLFRVLLFAGILLCLSLAGLGVAALERFYDSPFDQRHYLTQQQIAFVRPGLIVEIRGVNIAADRSVSVDFQATDDRGLPLDLDGIFTPGPVRVRFVLGTIPQGEDHYQSYITAVQTSPITGASAVHPAADTGGTFQKLQGGALIRDISAVRGGRRPTGSLQPAEKGVYRYTFGAKLPEGFDQTATHSIGFFADRDLSEFGLSTQVANGVFHFVPDGSEVIHTREVVVTGACNQCHDPLQAHGGIRRSAELCTMCHYSGVSDPDTGESLDFRVMIHKIHRGENLPSVQAGHPYRIIGFRQSVADFSEVAFPQDIRNCETCHTPEAAQALAYLLRPSRAACGSCHDNVNFVTGENHPGGSAEDGSCSFCHVPEGDLEFDASIRGAHTVPSESVQLPGIHIEILDVGGAGPGLSPTVHFRIRNNAGDPINPASLAGFSLLLAGPTEDYRFVRSERAVEGSVPFGDGYTYTFTGMIPADATGTFAIGAEANRNIVLNPGTEKQFTQRETAENPVFYFSVDGGDPQPRRQIVSDAKCEVCHKDLALHGAQRHNATAYCQFCHNPLASDVRVRPAGELPPASIDFKMLIHRIHRGEDLTRDFTIFGFQSSRHNYNRLLYPGDLRNCQTCHQGSSFEVPSEGVLATVAPREFFSPIPPNSAACLGCHDTLDAAAHAFVNIAPFGESCGVCHGSAAEFAVARVHAR